MGGLIGCGLVEVAALIGCRNRFAESAPRCLARARSAREGADAIPIDQLEVLAEDPAPALMLPAGEFIIEVQDPEGKPLTNFRVRKEKPE